MKKTLCAIAFCVAAPAAFASANWEAKYWDYANSIGDATPIGQHEWGVRNGYVQDNSRKERIVLSKEDQAEIARLNTFGDATPATAVKASSGPRKKLTAEDVEYIRFSNSFGDATPPSFNDWKASKAKGAL